MRFLRYVLVTVTLLLMGFPLVAHARSTHPSTQWMAAPVLNAQSSPETCMAMAMYHEARGESDRGMTGVGYVVLTRTRTEGYPPTVCGVVTQSVQIKGQKTRSCQFSWACTKLRIQRLNVAQFQRAQLLAILVLKEATPNPVGNALYFHEASLKHKPSRHSAYTARIEHHVFYADQRAVTRRPPTPEPETAPLVDDPAYDYAAIF